MAKPTFTLKNRVASTVDVCLLAGVGTARTQPAAKAGSRACAGSVRIRPQARPSRGQTMRCTMRFRSSNPRTKFRLRYRQRKVGAKGDTTREIIVSREGNVARLVERDGQPLTAAEDAEERARLTEDIDSPDDFLKHRSRDTQMRETVHQADRHDAAGDALQLHTRSTAAKGRRRIAGGRSTSIPTRPSIRRRCLPRR